jgi:hypothetical protein
VLVLGGGWLQLLLDEDVTAAKRLAFDLARAGLPVIQHSSEALRLAVTPDQIYFAANCFSYAYRQHGLQESRGQIDLVLNSVQTKFGDLEERAHSFPIPPNLADLVEAILAGRDPMKIEKIKNAGDLPKQNRESITTVVRDLGLRQFIRMPGSEKGKNLQPYITVPARKQ